MFPVAALSNMEVPKRGLKFEGENKFERARLVDAQE